jgi:hypothetical protein
MWFAIVPHVRWAGSGAARFASAARCRSERVAAGFRDLADRLFLTATKNPLRDGLSRRFNACDASGWRKPYHERVLACAALKQPGVTSLHGVLELRARRCHDAVVSNLATAASRLAGPRRLPSGPVRDFALDPGTSIGL